MEGEMVDFQYRVAMDTYEQMNGKLKAPPTYSLCGVGDERLAKPGQVARVVRAVWRVVASRRAGALRQPRGVGQGTAAR
jgi:hypothetical protein